MTEESPTQSRVRFPPAVLWLAGTVWLGALAGAGVPRPGLDESWMAAINIAAVDHLRFGRDVQFPFGPWGFLERPVLVSRPLFAAAVVFAIAATTALFSAVYAGVARFWSGAIAGPVAFVVTVATPASDPGLRMVCAAAILAILAIPRADRAGTYGRWDAWPIAVLFGAAALLLQVKFSEGLALLAIAGIVTASARSLRMLAINAVVAASTFPVSFVLIWLASGQRFGDLAPWLRGSWEMTTGYAEAMGLERGADVLAYLLAAVLAVVAGVLAVRLARGYRGAVAAGLVMLVVAVLVFGFKHGFTRHDEGHEPTYFIIVGCLLPVLARGARQRVAVLALAGLALAFVPRTLGQFDPLAARDRWRTSVEAIADYGYLARLATEGQQHARDRYGVAEPILVDLRDHPVGVDPWEATLPWAYGLDWHPMPVFQSYQAYTPALDTMNAEAAIAAPADQVILRESVDGIDGRNPRWETPRYLLALACHYRAGSRDGRWSVLRHDANRCAEPRPVERRIVDAGETVAVPQVGPDEILVATFAPRPDGFLASVAGLLLKDWSPFTVGTDDGSFRLPERLAGGPLLVSIPATLGWAEPFDGFQYTQLRFDRAGVLEFQAIAVG